MSRNHGVIANYLSFFFLGRIGVAGLAFATDIVLARIVSLEDRGVFYVFLTTISTLSLFLIFGLQNSITAKAASARPANLSILLSHLVLLIPGVVVLMVCLPFSPSDWLGTDDKHLLFYTTTAVMVVIVIRSFILGIGSDRWYLFLLLGDRLIFLVLLILFVHQHQMTPQAAYGASISSLLILTIMGLYYSTGNYEAATKALVNINEFKGIIRYSWGSYLGNFFIQLTSRVSVYFLTWFAGDVSVSIFMTALLLSQLALQFPMFISTLVFRDAAREFNHKMVAKIAWLSLVSAALISLVVFSEREWIIHALYGDQYKSSSEHVGYLLFSGVLMSPVIVIMNSLLGKGHARIYTIVFGVGFLVNLIANIALVPQFKIIGADFAAMISSMVCLIWSIYWFRKLT
jgi:O-antigen/teichoic acid export membrane protein